MVCNYCGLTFAKSQSLVKYSHYFTFLTDFIDIQILSFHMVRLGSMTYRILTWNLVVKSMRFATTIKMLLMLIWLVDKPTSSRCLVKSCWLISCNKVATFYQPLSQITHKLTVLIRSLPLSTLIESEPNTLNICSLLSHTGNPRNTAKTTPLHQLSPHYRLKST